MVYIALQEDKPAKIKQIAVYLNSSETHLAKILQTLSKKGFVTSARGRNGGFVLAKPANEINFNSIYECIESEICLESCPFSKDSCSFKNCIYGGFLNTMKAEIKDFFTGRYLSDVILEME
jgi:Rrf2 family iron-responsive transcriptional regulator